MDALRPGQAPQRLALRTAALCAALGWTACGSGQATPSPTPARVADHPMHFDSSVAARSFEVARIGNFQIAYAVGVSGDTPCSYSLALQPSSGSPIVLAHSSGPEHVGTGDRLMAPEAQGKETSTLSAGLWTLQAATGCHWSVDLTPLPAAPVTRGAGATP